jgi:hypothetical protein
LPVVQKEADRSDDHCWVAGWAAHLPAEYSAALRFGDLEADSAVR